MENRGASTTPSPGTMEKSFLPSTRTVTMDSGNWSGPRSLQVKEKRGATPTKEGEEAVRRVERKYKRTSHRNSIWTLMVILLTIGEHKTVKRTNVCIPTQIQKHFFHLVPGSIPPFASVDASTAIDSQVTSIEHQEK